MAAHAHPLVLDLALTIRHDGRGGVADDLAETAGLTEWVRRHAEELDGAGAAGAPVPEPFRAAAFVADEASLTAVRDLRTAVRSLFARAVRPGPPSPADARWLLPEGDALERLNGAAATVPVVPRLEWADGTAPVVVSRSTGTVPAHEALTAALARAAIAFLASPDRERLRACLAPRCVRYFLKEHPRQEWCKPSCGNRARVARHHERHRTPTS
ncbi:CGNR zinc finger domain-containing protein [Streptomyces sp. PKU-EA00015]|uniref:CGNR zinc finger domain-containing protein n=1 Tax=Streptomyces sp. PKU-EA00015 TaxID=2748326 RepID=UPI0015A3F7A2|nr:CGNR zinc finger domain-containing protein [Streptomyces sp. PKU-EA00015]NWF25441.1 CGNR zinc finger domain-containing protein [Streptomyces sp. PKU-EA00015]